MLFKKGASNWEAKEYLEKKVLIEKKVKLMLKSGSLEGKLLSGIGRIKTSCLESI